MGNDAVAELERWRARGSQVEVGGEAVFVVHHRPDGPVAGPPLFVVHGFPTSSVDWSPVLPTLGAVREVVLFDLPGYGLSDKPDRAYSIDSAADAAQGVISHLGLTELDLVTHDMGDTVGGELLARDLEGRLGATVRRRVVTNGSIYLALAQLTDGQRMLWEAPDARLPDDLALPADVMALSLLATLAPGTDPSSEAARHMAVAAEGVAAAGGMSLLPRLIRYLSDRRDNEARYTGAIEEHPSPLGIVWGAEDPIAVVAMAERLAQRRSDATLTVLDGVGHYPMVEAPGRFADAVLGALGDG